MDRVVIYPGQVPFETDLLSTNRNVQIDLGMLRLALLGSSTFVSGLACNPTSPASLQVTVGAGSIFSYGVVDATAYSSLAADTTHQIVHQGILLDPVTLTLTPPGTTGQSTNFLVQASYATTDAGSTVLPYYNASNPSVAWSGPNNSGSAQNTVRKSQCVISLKAGTPAATGSQVTPAPDSGNVGLYVITVANGASTITAGNISTYTGAPFISETLTQKISQATGDARYAQLGNANTWSGLQTFNSGANFGATGFAAVLDGSGNPAYQFAANVYIKYQGGNLNLNVAAGKNVYIDSSGNLNLIQNPTSALQAATKQYVDSVAQGLTSKPAVKAATTANITLSGTQTIDGVALVAGDRVLVKNQTASANNGIYAVASGAWSYVSDFSTWAQVPGAYVFVEGGTANANSSWVCAAPASGTLGSTSITFNQFAYAGSYSAGTGLTLSGSQFALAAAANNTLLGNVSGSSAAPGPLSASQVLTLLGIQAAEFNIGTPVFNSHGTAGAHGFASAPKRAQAFAKCIANDAATGYTAGQEVPINLDSTYGGGNGQQYGVGVSYDATNVYWSSGANGIYIPSMSGGGLAQVTGSNAANFNIIIRAAAAFY